MVNPEISRGIQNASAEMVKGLLEAAERQQSLDGEVISVKKETVIAMTKTEQDQNIKNPPKNGTIDHCPWGCGPPCAARKKND